MAKEKLEKFTANAAIEKTSHNHPFVQTESDLIEAQLEVLADELLKLTTFYTNFIEEEFISKEKLQKSAAIRK